MLQIILICIPVLLLLSYYFLTRNNNFWEKKNVPFEKPSFLFGNFYDVFKGKLHFSEKVRQLYSKYPKSPYVGLHVFTQPTLMVRSPDLLKKILVKDFDRFINRPIASDESVDPIAFHTLFSAQDATWRNLRSKISPVFTSGKMKLMLPLMQECANNLITHLREREGQEVETRIALKKFTVDIISSCAFGIDAHCLKDSNSEIWTMANQLLDQTSIVRNISMFSFFFAPFLTKLFRLTFLDQEATDYFINIFTRTKKERQKLEVERNDLIDLLYNLQKNETFADKYKFDDVKMAAQSVVFFSAGNDTTSTILAFALYELALNTDIQSRLREELNESDDFSYESLQTLKYLDMVVKETNRKYPLTTFLTREATTDYVFEETGLKLKKGDQIFVPLAGLHYDAEFYPEPGKFDPERFSDKTKTVAYTYMPFGDGPRGCIGERFANLVTKLALAYVVKNFQVEVSQSTPVPMELGTTTLFLTSKKGMFLKMVAINS